MPSFLSDLPAGRGLCLTEPWQPISKRVVLASAALTAPSAPPSVDWHHAACCCLQVITAAWVVNSGSSGRHKRRAQAWPQEKTQCRYSVLRTLHSIPAALFA